MSDPTEIQQNIGDIQSVLDQVRQQLTDDPEKLLGNPSPEMIAQIDRAIDIAGQLPAIPSEFRSNIASPQP